MAVEEATHGELPGFGGINFTGEAAAGGVEPGTFIRAPRPIVCLSEGELDGPAVPPTDFSFVSPVLAELEEPRGGRICCGWRL
jgi:hypothetical protein